MNNFGTTQKFKSHAKINLGLTVVNKREDGYHNIDSLFIELELHDTISFSPNDSFSLTTNFLDLPVDASNLVSKAYNLLLPHKAKSTPEYSIHLEKKIPMGGGLGGGSSNAATTLKALNQLWNCGFDNKNLCKLGASLGADVPFFIEGGIQHVTGIGEILNPVEFKALSNLQFLLIVPEIHVSTEWAYKALNISLQSNKKVPKFSPLTGPVIWQLFENDFERVIRSTYPEIDEIKSQLYDCGAIYAGMSGSGSTVFGIFDNRELLQKSSEQFTQCQSFITFPHIL
ncbi:MAG: 4-(cytidine 5'-diphospho)-2-C-methyl-D-erythritol kinase [Candidatus Marinimicrobia bacterium]|nr:4-(cytidine 5'-diphospho)-2-C-methyl-D-erythritol kinase [Candidatus Neomarinimicrobiota bacterium]